MKSAVAVACCVSLGILPGCATSIEGPDLRGLYTQSAMYHGLERNPVIVIPGILGSRLEDPASGKIVWGAFGGNYASPAVPEDLRLLALPMREGALLSELTDDVAVAGALDRLEVRLFSIPLNIQPYAYILASLGVGGYRDQQLAEALALDYGEDHFTCFQFAYDWRRDLTENAAALHRFLLEKEAYVREEQERRFGVARDPIKFDIVAHSMGGMLARYYLMYGDQNLPDAGPVPPVTWAGARHVERAILVGTPNGGSAQSLESLVEGAKYVPFFPRYPSALLGTFPAIYQLLPRARHHAVVDVERPEEPLDLLDVSVWKEMGWGLADPGQEDVIHRLLPEVPDPEQRRAIALEHLEKSLARTRRVHEALDQPAPRPEGLDLFLFAGDAVETPALLGVDRSTGRLVRSASGPGDGTVLRASAVMDERATGRWSPTAVSPIDWSGVTFLFTDHLGLTRDPAFTDNVLYLLLVAPRRSLSPGGWWQPPSGFP